MKRKALLIGDSGYNDDYLSGVGYDLENYKNFLKSLRGGAWYDEEISILSNKSKNVILSEIKAIKETKYDLVFVVFTGHGSYDNDKQYRMLSVGIYDESIYEKELWNLAPKQILILDSCSGCVQGNLSCEHNRNDFNQTDITKMRHKYEEICLQCPPQQIYLYASKIGTSAEDTENGGLYSTNLLEILEKNKIEGQYLDIVKAHCYTSIKIGKEGQETDKLVDISKKPYLPGAIKDIL